jgi:translation initiation factor 4E
MFKSGIAPVWEDPKNATGGEFRIIYNEIRNMPKVNNEIWEKLVLDTISNECRLSHLINGIRILDKS